MYLYVNEVNLFYYKHINKNVSIKSGNLFHPSVIVYHKLTKWIILLLVILTPSEHRGSRFSTDCGFFIIHK